MLFDDPFPPFSILFSECGFAVIFFFKIDIVMVNIGPKVLLNFWFVKLLWWKNQIW